MIGLRKPSGPFIPIALGAFFQEFSYMRSSLSLRLARMLLRIVPRTGAGASSSDAYINKGLRFPGTERVWGECWKRSILVEQLRIRLAGL